MTEEITDEQLEEAFEAFNAQDFKIGHVQPLSTPLMNAKGDTVLKDSLVYKSALTSLATEDLPLDFLGNMGKYPKKYWKPLISHMTGTPIALIEKIAFEDFEQAIGITMYFLVNGRGTGN
jgi:hypothetical protein